MIRIVTDSSADIPIDIADRLDVSVVPLTIRFGDEEFVDGHDLSPDQFWEKLATSDTLPETAAPSAGAFLDTFQRLADGGADGVVAICLSSVLSATYQSAVIAAEKMRGVLPVRVLDSMSVSMALGLQVLGAAERAVDGADLDDVATAAVESVPMTNVFAALDTLEYLRRGGRVGGVQAALGTLLDVKPLIRFVDGAVGAAGRVRTRSKALAAIVAEARKLAPRLESLAVIHGGAPDLDRLLESLGEALPDHDPIVAQLGPVVGTHSGPGAIGIAYRLR